MKGFGARLKAAREAAGLTQENVAQMLHIHRTTYTKYECDKTEPPMEILIELVNILEVSVNTLLTPQ